MNKRIGGFRFARDLVEDYNKISQILILMKFVPQHVTNFDSNSESDYYLFLGISPLFDETDNAKEYKIDFWEKNGIIRGIKVDAIGDFGYKEGEFP